MYVHTSQYSYVKQIYLIVNTIHTDTYNSVYENRAKSEYHTAKKKREMK